LKSDSARLYLQEYLKGKDPDEQKYFSCMLEGKYGKGTKDLYVTATVAGNAVVLAATLGASAVISAGAVAAEGITAAETAETVETAVTAGRSANVAKILSAMLVATPNLYADSLFWQCGDRLADSSQKSNSCVGDTLQSAIKSGHPELLPSIVSQSIDHKNCSNGAAVAAIGMIVPSYRLRILAAAPAEMLDGETVLMKVGQNYETVTVTRQLGTNIVVKDARNVAYTIPKSSAVSMKSLVHPEDTTKYKQLLAAASDEAKNVPLEAPPGMDPEVFKSIAALKPNQAASVVMETSVENMYGQKILVRKIYPVSGSNGVDAETNTVRFGYGSSTSSIDLAKEGSKIKAVSTLKSEYQHVIFSSTNAQTKAKALASLGDVPTGAQVTLRIDSSPPIKCSFVGLSTDGSTIVYSIDGRNLFRPINSLTAFEYHGTLFN